MVKKKLNDGADFGLGNFWGGRCSMVDLSPMDMIYMENYGCPKTVLWVLSWHRTQAGCLLEYVETYFLIYQKKKKVETYFLHSN